MKVALVSSAPAAGIWTIKVKTSDLPEPYQRYSIIAGDQDDDRLGGQVDIMQVRLFDDGKHRDRKARDGIYAANFILITTQELKAGVKLRIDIDGKKLADVKGSLAGEWSGQ